MNQSQIKYVENKLFFTDKIYYNILKGSRKFFEMLSKQDCYIYKPRVK